MSPNRHRQVVRKVTDDEYNEMLHQQNFHCALCPSTPKTRRLHIDHDHAGMGIRGLLCYRCNRALPNYVTAQWLRAAADYLERTETRLALKKALVDGVDK